MVSFTFFLAGRQADIPSRVARVIAPATQSMSVPPASLRCLMGLGNRTTNIDASHALVVTPAQRWSSRCRPGNVSGFASCRDQPRYSDAILR